MKLLFDENLSPKMGLKSVSGSLLAPERQTLNDR